MYVHCYCETNEHISVYSSQGVTYNAGITEYFVTSFTICTELHYYVSTIESSTCQGWLVQGGWTLTVEDCKRLPGRAVLGHLEQRVLVSLGLHSSYIRVQEECNILPGVYVHQVSMYEKNVCMLGRRAQKGLG